MFTMKAYAGGGGGERNPYAQAIGPQATAQQRALRRGGGAGPGGRGTGGR